MLMGVIMEEGSKILLNKNMLLISGVIVVAAITLYFALPGILFPINSPSIVSPTSPGSITDLTQIAPSVKPRQAQVGSAVGNSAPDFTVTTVDGKQIRLSDSRESGKPVLVYFFAIWCPFCKSDLTAVKSVYPKYQDKIDFVIIDLDISEDATEIINYRDANGFVGEFAPGSRALLIDYNILSTTTKFAIDSDGVILWRGSGAIGSSDWDKLFRSLADL